MLPNDIIIFLLRFLRLHQLKNFNTLSIGMSNDYKLAIDNGSNMVRIGSLIFGERK